MTKAEMEKELAVLKQENKRLMQSVTANEFKPTPIKGVFKVEYNTPGGKKVSKTVKFADGHTAIRIKDGHLVNAESLLKLANGDELKDADFVSSEKLKNWDTEDAKSYLTHLAKIGYGYLVEVK